jgi:uncharacterized protein with PIN domain
MEHYCDFRVINDNEDGVLSMCIECKKKLVTKKDKVNGRIDNKKYLEANKRSYAQPGGRTGKIFEKYYGEAPKDLRFK